MIRMRETQIIKALLDRAILRAHEAGATSIGGLRLAIGEIAELDQRAIRSLWNDLSTGTLAEGAQLHFNVLPAEAQCMSCFQKYHPPNGEIHCPYCGGFGAKILTGEELYIESIELIHE